jgi:hypothetical protein
LKQETKSLNKRKRKRKMKKRGKRMAKNRRRKEKGRHPKSGSVNLPAWNTIWIDLD